MSLANTKKSLAVGVGIGPFNSVAAEKSCAKFLNECGYVGVRDNASLDIAQTIAPNANVHKTFDLAPLLLCSNKGKTHVNERKGIALTLCSVAVDAMGKTNKFEEEKRVQQFIQLITQLYQKTGEPITLIEFNGHSVLGDWKINNNIVARLDKSIPVSIKKYDPNPIALLNNLSGYKAIVSMRLHGSILGYLAKTPVLSINYHSKCNGWCDEVGMPADYHPEGVILDNYFNIASQGDLPFTMSSMVIQRSLFEAIGGFPLNEPIGEDQDLFCRVALNTPIAYSPNIHSLYHKDAQNQASKNNIPSTECGFSIRITKEATKHKKTQSAAYMLKYSATHLCHLAKLNIGNGHFSQARTLLSDPRCKLKPKHLIGLYGLSWIKQTSQWLVNTFRYITISTLN
jgi:hypothetical protein